MRLLHRDTERDVALLTKVAFGDVALVRDALVRHGNDSIEAVVHFIQEKRDPARAPARQTRRPELG